MRTRKLFIGDDAVDSILEITSNVDNQFIKVASKRWATCLGNFSPWMSLPFNMGTSPAVEWPKNKYPRGKELLFIRTFIEQLDPLGRPLPSMESYPIKVSNLNEAEEDVFYHHLGEAEALVCKTTPWIDALKTKIVRNFVPVESLLTNDTADYGMSVIWLKGVVFYEKRQIRPLNIRAENLAHEVAHQVLINYQLSDRLIVGDLNRSVFSAIRKQRRPAILALHGAAALSYMLIIARDLRAEERVIKLKADLTETLQGLEDIPMTKIGKVLLVEMQELVRL